MDPFKTVANFKHVKNILSAKQNIAVGAAHTAALQLEASVLGP